jgi:hypothetical protein|tara:strand:+ start:186 stop:512 length:327 start_codon:yes stop_codon:yes gene_type:complete
MKKSKIIQAIEEVLAEKKRPGLWANINAKKKRGEKPSHGNSNAHKDAVAAGKAMKKEGSDHEPMNPGILKKRLGELSCTKVKAAKGKLKDKGTTYAKALQRYLNYHCQ